MITYLFLFSFFFLYRFRFVHVVSSPCLIYMYIYLQGKGDMIPAALPVVPISLSLLARYVITIPKREKRKKNPKKPTAFYF